MKKRILSLILCFLLMMGLIVPSAAAEIDDGLPDFGSDKDLTTGAAQPSCMVTKVSNPDRGAREADGLVEGGDRENSYAWSLAMRGDEIYIATARSVADLLVNQYAPAFSEAGVSLDTLWALIEGVTGGDIPRSDADEGASILSYNRATGAFKVIYTADPGDSFPTAVTYGDDVYFGSCSAVNPQYILKLDAEGSFTKVFETTGSVSLRANCVYDDSLFFAGADDRTPLAVGEDAPAAMMAVLMKSGDDDTVWNRVADFRDFGTTAYDPIYRSLAASPVWELASHDGYIYAAAPSSAGFVIYKGHPAGDGETPNVYGWYWKEVVGPTNGVNNPGLGKSKRGEPGTMRSLIGSVYEFNGELYAYSFDHALGGAASAFTGIAQQAAGQDVKASDYLYYLYNSLQNPQKVWKLNDETGKFAELRALTELTEDTANEYIWRLGEYDGDLYVATMDAGVFYDYLTQLTSGSFFRMTTEEKLQKLGCIADMIKTLAVIKASEIAAPISEMIAELQTMLEKVETDLASIALEAVMDMKTLQTIMEYTTLLTQVKKFAEQMVQDIKDGFFDYSFAFGKGGDAETDGQLASTGALDVSSVLTSLLQFLPRELSEQFGAEIARLILSDDYQAALEDLIARIKPAVKDAIIDAIRSIASFAGDLYDQIDGDGVRMYLEINNMLTANEWGFDLFRTCDGGESFEVITRDGFGDPYNCGCPCFLETEEGLYLGTANPFYGGQLYLLTNEESEPIDDDFMMIIGDADGDEKITVLDATRIQRWLAGMAGDDELKMPAADSDGDSTVTIFDATAIQRWLVGLPTAEGIGELYEEPQPPAEDVLTMTTMGEVYTAYPRANKAISEGRAVIVVADEEHAYRVSAPLSADQYEAIVNIPFGDPKTEEKTAAILSDVPIASCEDLIPQKLTDDQLTALIGTTGQELLDAGYLNTGYSVSEEGILVATFAKGAFDYEITFNGKVTDDESFDVDEACKPLTVASAEYVGISAYAAD